MQGKSPKNLGGIPGRNRGINGFEPVFDLSKGCLYLKIYEPRYLYRKERNTIKMVGFWCLGLIRTDVGNKKMKELMRMRAKQAMELYYLLDPKIVKYVYEIRMAQARLMYGIHKKSRVSCK